MRTGEDPPIEHAVAEPRDQARVGGRTGHRVGPAALGCTIAQHGDVVASEKVADRWHPELGEHVGLGPEVLVLVVVAPEAVVDPEGPLLPRLLILAVGEKGHTRPGGEWGAVRARNL